MARQCVLIIGSVYFAIVVTAASSASSAGQSADTRQATAVSSSMPTQMMSPAVVATWVTERTGNDAERLLLLVLWRGTPGWFLRPGGSSVYGSQAGGRYEQTITQGGVTFTLGYEPATRVAVVNGKSIAMAESNVILVDDVDSPAGPRVIKTMTIESRMPGSAGQIGLVLRLSPEVMSFLRCDAEAPEGPGQAFLRQLCLQNIGVRGAQLAPGW